MDETKVGARIAKLRAEKNMTQAALGELLGVSDKTVSKWENGGCYPDVSLFPKLADTFGVTVDYLMRGEGQVMQKIAMGTPAQSEETTNCSLRDGMCQNPTTGTVRISRRTC